MGKINIRPGHPKDSSIFLELVKYSAPTFLKSLFSPHPDHLMVYLFENKNNIFSHEFTHFIESDGRPCGMLLGYKGKTKKQSTLNTGLLLAKFWKNHFLLKIRALLRAQNIVGYADENDFYVSNVAVFPETRSMGLGRQLLVLAETHARKQGAANICLDVETNNPRAKKLYEEIGYKVQDIS
jgi:ribosomal protein S18 acetylase RimI-like enzyme